MPHGYKINSIQYKHNSWTEYFSLPWTKCKLSHVQKNTNDFKS